MIVRTAKFRLVPTEEQAACLLKTQQEYIDSWQYCVDAAWRLDRLSRPALHAETYSFLRASTGLPAQFCCSAIGRALESVKSARALQRKKKKVSKPRSNSIPIRLDARTMSFDKTKDTVSFSSNCGRIRLPLVWNEYALQFKHWDVTGGELSRSKNGKWFLSLSFKAESFEVSLNGTVVGVDRGISKPAVTSDNAFIGQQRWKAHERRLRKHIAKLQSKGTKSAKRKLKKLSGRLRRFKTDCDRVVAKSILSELDPGTIVVLEDIVGIRDRCGTKESKVGKRHRTRMSRWSYTRMMEALCFAAERAGVYVVTVDPSYTSQRCSRCGCISKSHRKSQSLYRCSQCGLQLNADLNASRNLQFVWGRTTCLAPGLPVNQPIVGSSFAY